MKSKIKRVAEIVANNWLVKLGCLSLMIMFEWCGRVWGFLKFRALISVPPNSSCHWSVVIKFPQNVKISGPIMISPNCVLGAKSQISIGSNVRLSQGVHLETASLDLNSALPYEHIAKEINIGDGVWIGAHAVILGGVTIGENAIIGAGVVVSKDVPAGAIVVGQSIRFIEKKADYRK